MGRGKRTSRAKKPPVEHATAEEDIDPSAEGFHRDEVDEFHSQREKVLLERSGRELSSDSGDQLSDQEEEVMALDLSGSEEEQESDDNSEEDYDDDDDDDVIGGESPTEISDKAWGKSKKAFYSTDYVDYDVGAGLSEGEGQEAELEEREAMALQQRMAAALSEADFEAPDNTISGEKKEEVVWGEEGRERVTQDLSKLSRKEQLALLEKDSPELFEFMDDFQLKFAEVTETILPLVQASKDHELLTPQGLEYLQTKLHLNLCYCLNILFYLRLKACRAQVASHPVIKQIVQIRQFVSQMAEVDRQIEPQIENALQSLKDENQVSVEAEGTDKHSHTTWQSNGLCEEVQGEVRPKEEMAAPSPLSAVKEEEEEEVEGALEYYERVRASKRARKRVRNEGGGGGEMVVERAGGEDGEAEDGKRAITYQIARNKGLTPKRRKEQRNPRVRHRKKFKKAIVKRRSQVLPVVTEMSKYGGEASGIRSNLSRSVRIK